jgi:mono/diheme cytochrome c family protein
MAHTTPPAGRHSLARRILRWIGYALGSLVALVIVAAIAIFALSEARVRKVYDTQPVPVQAATDLASVERGKHLVVNLLACVSCHGDTMSGGIVADDPALGRAVAPNLTTGQGGIGGQRTDTDLVRAIRHGVKPDGTSMFVMPVNDYVALNERDMAAIIAYLRSLPPVDSQLPQSQLGPLGRVLIATGLADLLSAESVPQTGGFSAEIPAGPTIEYGGYLARTSGCMGCHGATLSGGPIPGTPPDFPTPPNITPASAIQGWTDAELAAAIRQGMRPGGSMIDPFMPYEYYAAMTDEEVAAIIAYVRSVPPKPFGNR